METLDEKGLIHPTAIEHTHNVRHIETIPGFGFFDFFAVVRVLVLSIALLVFLIEYNPLCCAFALLVLVFLFIRILPFFFFLFHRLFSWRITYAGGII